MEGNKKSVHIAFICDNGYVLPTSVAITSLILNKKDETFYYIYIIATELSEESKSMFVRFGNETVKIHVIEVDLGELSHLHTYSNKSVCVATPAALLKFRLPELLNDISKVLYLDGDVIVRCDLSELFQTELTGYYAGAVIDSGSIYSKNANVLRRPNYFNSGVMLLNLDKMRQDKCTERLIREKKSSKDSSLMDQNIFNAVFEGKVKFLNIRYNCLYINLVRASKKFTIEELNNKYKESFKTLKEIADEAKIVHYSSKDKPWKYYDVPLANEWYMYYLQMRNRYSPDSEAIMRSPSPWGKNDNIYYQEKYRPDIVVSLTTYPARIQYVHIPIIEMLNQSVKATHVILWLAKEQFPGLYEELPETLTELIPQGLEIRWCDEDLKSHKKYFYVMQEFTDSIIITIDDDLHYSPYLIEKLLDSYKRFPMAVSAMRVHLMLKDKDNPKQIAPYSTWKKEYATWLGIPSMQLFATSGAGTLFPPYCMSAGLFNKETIKSCCLFTDDIWLKVNQVMVGTPVVLADLHQRLTYVEGTQDVGLWKENVVNGENDEQLRKILDKYSASDFNSDFIISHIFESSPYPNKHWKDKRDRQTIPIEYPPYEELEQIRNSISYKIGKMITFVPRKILGGIRCYREHGWGYTWQRVLVHLGLRLDPWSGRGSRK